MLEQLAEPLAVPAFQRALVMALLLGASCGVVGCVLLLRRIVLIADSFGHALLPGIGLAYLWLGPGHAGLYLGAALAGLATALLSGLLHQLTRLPEDAAFGALFACCFAAGVILMHHAAPPGDLLHYLFGDILAVTGADLWRAWATAGATMLALCLGYRPLLMEGFDPDFLRAAGGRPRLVHLGVLAAVVLNIVAALQAVGLVLALGLFLLPAAIAYLWCDRWEAMLLAAAGIGGLGSAAGLLASWWLDWPSGPSMVAALGLLCLASALAGRHGLAARRRPRRHRAGDDDATCVR